MTVKRYIARIAVFASALALAAPALADPPQLRNDVADFDTPAIAELGAPDGWAAKYVEGGSGGPAIAELGAPDGWAAKYVESGSGAARHPDNGIRHLSSQQPGAVASDPAGGFDWRSSVLGVLVFAVVLVTAGTVVVRTRTRLVRA